MRSLSRLCIVALVVTTTALKWSKGASQPHLSNLQSWNVSSTSSANRDDSLVSAFWNAPPDVSLSPPEHTPSHGGIVTLGKCDADTKRLFRSDTSIVP